MVDAVEAAVVEGAVVAEEGAEVDVEGVDVAEAVETITIETATRKWKRNRWQMEVKTTTTPTTTRTRIPRNTLVLRMAVVQRTNDQSASQKMKRLRLNQTTRPQ